MKEPATKTVNVRPMLYKTPSPRSRAYRAYQQQKIRQQRIALLALGLMVLIGLAGISVWGIYKGLHPLITRLQGPQETAQFEALLDQDLGPVSAPSLLYDNNPNTLLQARRFHAADNGTLFPLRTDHEDMRLKEQIQSILAEYPGDRFIPYLYVYNPQDGTYVEVNGYAPVSAASVIKLPILMDYLMHLDARDIAIDTPLLYADFHRAGGSGEMQYRPSGEEYTANAIAAQMIRISDNTCTNMMISYLGGTDVVNHRLEQLGLRQTRIRNWLPDLTGTNTISPYEMSTILYNIEQGRILSQTARANGIEILESVHNRHLLVAPLPKEAVVAHKTGDIGTALGDSGIVYLPDGRKYIISMQVERPFNDYTARDMVQRVSRAVYDYIANQPTPASEGLQAKLPNEETSAESAMNGEQHL